MNRKRRRERVDIFGYLGKWLDARERVLEQRWAAFLAEHGISNTFNVLFDALADLPEDTDWDAIEALDKETAER